MSLLPLRLVALLAIGIVLVWAPCRSHQHGHGDGEDDDQPTDNSDLDRRLEGREWGERDRRPWGDQEPRRGEPREQDERRGTGRRHPWKHWGKRHGDGERHHHRFRGMRRRNGTDPSVHSDGGLRRGGDQIADGDRKNHFCTKRFPRLHEKVRNIIQRNDYGHKRKGAKAKGRSLSPEKMARITQLITNRIQRRCQVVELFLNGVMHCNKTSRIRKVVGEKINKSKRVLVKHVRRLMFSSITSLCRNGGLELEEFEQNTVAFNSTSMSNDTALEWKIIERCEYLGTMVCVARVANISVDLSDPQISYETRKPFRRRCPFTFPNFRKFQRSHKKAHYRFGCQTTEPTAATIQTDNDTDSTDLEDKDESAAAKYGTIALQVVIAVAVIGFVVFFGVYVMDRRRRLGYNKRSASDASVSTTLTDAGEYYATESPLDVWPGKDTSTTGVSAHTLDDKGEIQKIAKSGWHNPVYDFHEQAAIIASDGPESEL